MSSLNFPNFLTLIRITLIPVLVACHYSPLEYNRELAAVVFILASFTDWLDGYLARKLNQETKFGAFCDPVADKLIVVIALMLLLESFNNYFITIPAIIIVSRELIISGLREWMAHQGQSQLVSVMFLSKVKTTLQMVAISVLLFCQPNVNLWYVQIGILLLCFAAGITLLTMLMYLYYAWPKLHDGAL